MAEAKRAKATSKEGKGGGNGSVPTAYPIVEVQGAKVHELGRKVNPKELAQQLEAIRGTFVEELHGKSATGAYELEWLEISLTVGVGGSIAFPTASAEGSITLHIKPK